MKNRLLKAGLITAIVLHSITGYAQQDVQFSQYMFNPLVLNTAYAGYRGETYANVMYRKQWVNLPGAPESFTASVEGLLPNMNDRVALSARVLSDNLGPQKTLSAFVGYTYRVPLNEDGTKRLCVGLAGGLDDNDQLVPVGVSKKIVPDFNAGAYYYSPKCYVSFGVNNILEVNAVNTNYSWQGTNFESMEKKLHGYVGAGMVFNLSNTLKFKPSFLWKEDFRGPSNIDLNGFILVNDIVWLGGSYRTGLNIWNRNQEIKGLDRNDAVSLIVELFPFKRLRIGYAYDITTSKLNSYQNGTHELSIGIGFPHKDGRELSPRFF